MSTKQDRIDELEEVLEYAVEGTLDNVVQWIQGVDALTSMAAAIYYYSVKIPEIEQYQQQQQQYWIKAMKDQRDAFYFQRPSYQPASITYTTSSTYMPMPTSMGDFKIPMDLGLMYEAHQEFRKLNPTEQSKWKGYAYAATEAIKIVIDENVMRTLGLDKL